MMRFLCCSIVVCAIVFITASTSHADITPPVFTCDPDTFVFLPTQNGYRLMGTLDTPTPNYTYEMNAPTGVRRDLLQAPITLIAPEGISATMIGTLNVDHAIETRQNLMRFTASIKKEFDWGPEVIHCARYIVADEPLSPIKE